MARTSVKVDDAEVVPRRRDATATRESILAAGKRLFSSRGYGQVGIRDLAAAAGVDAALVMRYFGSKEGLFDAVVDELIGSEGMFDGDPAQLPQRLAAYMADCVPGECDDHGDPLQLIVRSLGDPVAAARLARAIAEHWLQPMCTQLEGSEVALRARLILAQLLGLGLFRHLLEAPEAESIGPQQLEKRLTRMLEAVFTPA
jgi:AcrR family transcriptional regulator